jgi:hypothetical protein
MKGVHMTDVIDTWEPAALQPLIKRNETPLPEEVRNNADPWLRRYGWIWDANGGSWRDGPPDKRGQPATDWSEREALRIQAIRNAVALLEARGWACTGSGSGGRGVITVDEMGHRVDNPAPNRTVKGPYVSLAVAMKKERIA